MKPALNLENEELTHIEKLVDASLIDQVVQALLNEEVDPEALKKSIIQAYEEYLLGYLETQRYQPENVEVKALEKVEKQAKQLLNAIEELNNTGHSDKRLADALKYFDTDRFQPENNLGIWNKLIKDQSNPLFYVRKLIADLSAAADHACDKSIQNEGIEPEIAEILEEILDPNHEKERKQRILDRKTPKDLGTLRALIVLEGFWQKHILQTFTAGHHYKGIGQISPTLDALEIIFKRIAPEITRQNISTSLEKLKNFKAQNL